MWHIQKINPSDLIGDEQYIAFVGAGGKTSFIEYLAGKTAKKGKKTAITTTTKIYAREPYVLLVGNGNAADIAENPIRIGKSLEECKLTAVTFDDLRELGRSFDTILIEADGAKGKPLKYPAPYEPVIPPFAGIVFVLAGLDGLSGRIEDKVFRWHILREKRGMGGDQAISPELFGLFFSDEMLLKDVGPTRGIIVLNKYDTLMDKKDLIPAVKELIRKTGAGRVIVASLAFGIFYEVRLCGP